MADFLDKTIKENKRLKQLYKRLKQLFCLYFDSRSAGQTSNGRNVKIEKRDFFCEYLSDK